MIYYFFLRLLLGMVTLLSVTHEMVSLEAEKPSIVAAHGLGDNGRNYGEYLKRAGLLKDASFRPFSFSDVNEVMGGHVPTKSHLGQKGDVAKLQQEINACPGSIKLIGTSRGGATVINWDGNSGKGNRSVRTIVAEAPFASVKDVADYKINDTLKSSNWFFDLFFSSPSRMALTTESAHDVATGSTFPEYERQGMQPIKSIANGTKPTLILAYKNDPIVPSESTRKLYKAACAAGRTNVHYHIIPGNRHVGIFDEPQILRLIHAFWKKYGDAHDVQLAAAGEALLATTQPSL